MRTLLAILALAFTSMALAQSGGAGPANPDPAVQIRGQIAAGKSDGEIRDYMVQRYGDFVLYKPPFQVNTLALWIAPVALLVTGVFVFLVVVRRRRTQPPPPGASPRRAEIEKLLDGP
jgi:cytochrome c-type biogenesis protein CcmH